MEATKSASEDDQQIDPVPVTTAEAPQEVEYGPSIRDPTRISIIEKMEDSYDRLCCWIVTCTFLFGPPILTFLCFLPPFWIFGILYLIWMLYDRKTPHRGGRRILLMRKFHFWRYRRNYFPIKLVKTAELPPDTTYLFSSFPHGILVFGASTNFMSDANHFDKAFPGLNPYAMALNMFFKIPFVRELILFAGKLTIFGIVRFFDGIWGVYHQWYSGMCAATPEGISYVLNGSPGNVCVLVVGGAAEFLKSVPGTYRITLKNRKGFVKLALKAGSSLVPVFSFGETDMYDQVTGEWYEWFQEKFRATTGIPFVLLKGSGILNQSFGLVPYKRPITTVVGKPIKLPKTENPTDEMVNQYHQVFMQDLAQLFDKYKGKYDARGDKAVLLIE